MEHGAVDHRVLMRPQNQVSDLIGRYQPAKAVHGAKICQYGFIVADMLAQHGRIGKSGADKRGVDAAPHKVLTSGPHHAQLGMLAHHVAKGTGNGFFRQRRAHVKHAGTAGHLRQ